MPATGYCWPLGSRHLHRGLRYEDPFFSKALETAPVNARFTHFTRGKKTSCRSQNKTECPGACLHPTNTGRSASWGSHQKEKQDPGSAVQHPPPRHELSLVRGQSLGRALKSTDQRYGHVLRAPSVVVTTGTSFGGFGRAHSLRGQQGWLWAQGSWERKAAPMVGKGQVGTEAPWSTRILP